MILEQNWAPLQYATQVRRPLHEKLPNQWLRTSGPVCWTARSSDFTHVASSSALFKNPIVLQATVNYSWPQHRSSTQLQALQTVHSEKCSKALRTDFRSKFAKMRVTPKLPTLAKLHACQLYYTFYFIENELFLLRYRYLKSFFIFNTQYISLAPFNIITIICNNLSISLKLQFFTYSVL